MKTNPWTYKLKDLNREKILGSSNYATKKELEHARGIDASDLAAKKDFIALKAEVDKLDINKLTMSTNLKSKSRRFRCW